MLRHPLSGSRWELEATYLGLIFSRSGPFVARFSGSPKRSDLEIKSTFIFKVGQRWCSTGTSPGLSLCPNGSKSMGQSFLSLPRGDGSSLQILSSGLLGQGWMGTAQPSKLLFLFMITFLLEGNCWCLLFRWNRLVIKGIVPCDEKCWTEPRHSNTGNP